MVKDVNRKFRFLKLYFDIKEGRTSLYKEALPKEPISTLKEFMENAMHKHCKFGF